MTDWKALADTLGVGHLTFDADGTAKMPGGAVLMLDPSSRACPLVYEDRDGNQIATDTRATLADALRDRDREITSTSEDLGATVKMLLAGALTAKEWCAAVDDVVKAGEGSPPPVPVEAAVDYLLNGGELDESQSLALLDEIAALRRERAAALANVAALEADAKRKQRASDLAAAGDRRDWDECDRLEAEDGEP